MGAVKTRTPFVILAAVGLIVAFAASAPAHGSSPQQRGHPDEFTDVIMGYFEDTDELDLEDIEELGGGRSNTSTTSSRL